MPPSMRSALLSLLLLSSACGVFCPAAPTCPAPPKPLPPPPPKIVEVVKPCEVPDPLTPFTAQDMPRPDAAGQVTLSQEATVKLAQSILGWTGYVKLVKAQCRAPKTPSVDPLPVP